MSRPISQIASVALTTAEFVALYAFLCALNAWVLPLNVWCPKESAGCAKRILCCQNPCALWLIPSGYAEGFCAVDPVCAVGDSSSVCWMRSLNRSIARSLDFTRWISLVRRSWRSQRVEGQATSCSCCATSTQTLSPSLVQAPSAAGARLAHQTGFCINIALPA